MQRLTTWLRRQPAESWITALLVAGSIVFVFVQLQPRLLLRNTTPNGGDMGAHVLAPAYLRDHLLPHFRLSGWTPDWYDGFPIYQFYMVVPSLLIVLLDVVFFLPYNVAFKLVSVSGLLALPFAAWWLGRAARLPFPAPAALAVAAAAFEFERSFTITGGNAFSTLAGEFAFSISLVFALLFLGAVIRGLETGRSRGLAALFLGLTVTCHLIPGIFALIAAATAFIVYVDWRRIEPNRLRLIWLGSAVGVGALLTSFWTLPFLMNRRFMTDMGWEKTTTYLQSLFPGGVGRWLSQHVNGSGHHILATAVPGDMTYVIALAAVGVVTSLAFRRRFGIWLVLTALTFAVLVVVFPQNRLWNARLLPFWYLCLYLLAALAVAELLAALATLFARDPDTPNRIFLLEGTVVAALVATVIVGLPLRDLPFGHMSKDGARYSWLGISTKDHNDVPSWAKWNYSGYEDKGKTYPKYHALVTAMGAIGKERGCGRAMWEYSFDELNPMGTPMALMLLPYWTDSCIGSMEGLYFEASATTPYHFINQSELSPGPSRAERDLPYPGLDVSRGVQHLQLLGVKYFMAFTPSVVAQADQNPNLTPLETVLNWHIYEVADADLVQALQNQPAVVKGMNVGGKTWEHMAVDWYLDPAAWSVARAADGPKSWQRISKDAQPAKHANASAKVTKIQTGLDTIRFHVDRPGVPVLVKASYFPNWRADNAKGPYRVAPNLMVVVPTGHDVELQYGRTSIDYLAILLTLAAIGLTVVLWRRPLSYPEGEPVAEDDAPSGDDDGDGDAVLVGAGAGTGVDPPAP